MKISEIYFKEFTLKEFCRNIEEEYVISEGQVGALTNLIKSANKLIFNKFRIKPSDKTYVIAGSARLYVHEELRTLFNLKSEIGDLDIVIPNKEVWVKAGLEEAYTKGGIYRPEEDDQIEAFNIWKPSLAGGDYANVQVRSTDEIMADANQVGGYYFMSLYDVIDYKVGLNRDKEKDIVSLISSYNSENSNARKKTIFSIVDALSPKVENKNDKSEVRQSRAKGLEKTKEFLGRMGK